MAIPLHSALCASPVACCSAFVNPDGETLDWRAVCGRTARTVRRAGTARAVSDPYQEGYIMKTAIFVTALLLVIPLAAPAAESDLYGTWKLVSLSRKVIDTGKMEESRGKAPKGYVSFTPDGRVLGMIVNEKRPKPESVVKLTDQQRIELFNTMNAYAATYKLDGNKLTYRFDLTHNEVAERVAVREIKIEGRKLTMANEPGRNVADGKMAQTTTVWEKVQAPAAAKK